MKTLFRGLLVMILVLVPPVVAAPAANAWGTHGVSGYGWPYKATYRFHLCSDRDCRDYFYIDDLLTFWVNEKWHYSNTHSR